MPCPICEKPAAKPFTPFCSERCRLVDLGKWLKGSYAVPAVETDEALGEDDNDADFSPLPPGEGQG